MLTSVIQNPPSLISSAKADEHQRLIDAVAIAMKTAELAEICRSTQTPYAASVEKAGGEHLEAFAVAPVDPHFNRKGHALVARTIFKALKFEGLAPLRDAPSAMPKVSGKLRR